MAVDENLYQIWQSIQQLQKHFTHKCLMLVAEVKSGDHQSHWDKTLGNHEYTKCSANPACECHCYCEKYFTEQLNLLVVLEERSGITIRIHPLGTMDICTKFHGNTSNIC